jgi:hypothetical protein
MRRDFPEQRQERTEPADIPAIASRRSAWITTLRVLVTAVLCVLLVGFGLCGAYGTFAGLLSGASRNLPDGLLFLVPGAIGLGIGWLCWKAIARIWRKPGPPSE